MLVPLAPFVVYKRKLFVCRFGRFATFYGVASSLIWGAPLEILFIILFIIGWRDDYKQISSRSKRTIIKFKAHTHQAQSARLSQELYFLDDMRKRVTTIPSRVEIRGAKVDQHTIFRMRQVHVVPELAHVCVGGMFH